MSASKPYSFIVGVLGVRDFNNAVYTNYDYICATMDDYLDKNRIPPGFLILTGGGRGVETLVGQWAEERGYALRKIPPNIEQFGAKKAFSIRNHNIVAEAKDVVIFWDGYTEVTREALVSTIHMQKRAIIYPLV